MKLRGCYAITKGVNPLYKQIGFNQVIQIKVVAFGARDCQLSTRRERTCEPYVPLLISKFQGMPVKNWTVWVELECSKQCFKNEKTRKIKKKLEHFEVLKLRKKSVLFL